MKDLVVYGGPVPTYLIESIQTQLKPAATKAQGIQAIRFSGVASANLPDVVHSGLINEHLDWAFVPTGRSLNDFKLVVFDMDSTLINIECIDELADFAGRKAEVSAITEAAMRGEIDYRESLRQRLLALVDAVHAQRAALDAALAARHVGLLVDDLLVHERARLVWAGHHAVTAADAAVAVHQHDAVGALERRAGGADVDAGRLGAVLAHHRHRGRAAGLDLLDLDDLLLLAGLGGLLLLLELELPVVEDLAHRRLGIGRDLDEVEIGLFGHHHRLADRHDADILAGGIDQAHFARVNAVVDPVSFFLLRGGGSAAYRRPPGWHWQVVFSSCVRGAFSKHPLGFGCERYRH